MEKGEIRIKLSTVILLFIIIILVIALGIVYYFGFIKDNKQIQEHNTNTSDMITNHIIQETPNNNIESQSKKTSYGFNNVFTVLVDGIEKNLIGTYAFEKKYSSNEAGRTEDIYAIKTDGTELKIAENVSGVRDIWYDNSKLYCLTINNCTTIDLTNAEFNMNTFQLADDINPTWIAGSSEDTIYYSSSYFNSSTSDQKRATSTYYIGAYSINDKTNKVLYTTLETLRDMSINKNKGLIYFIADNSKNLGEEILYSYNIKTGYITEILRFIGHEYNDNDGWRDYFYGFFNNQFVYQEKEDGYLYSYNLENNQKNIILKDIPYASALFKENHLYYSKVENGKCHIVKTDGKNNEVIYTKDVDNKSYLQLFDHGINKMYITVSDGIVNGYWNRIINTSGTELNEQLFKHLIYYLK